MEQQYYFILTHWGAGIAQLVVLGLAVHSVEGSILLWDLFVGWLLNVPATC